MTKYLQPNNPTGFNKFLESNPHARKLLKEDFVAGQLFAVMCEIGGISLMEIAIKHGLDLGAIDPSSGMYVAATKGTPEFLEYLLEDLKLDPNAKHQGFTALAAAVERNLVGNVRVLLKHGADPDGEHQMYRSTTLQVAARNAISIEIVKMLIEAGATVDAEDVSGRSIEDYFNAPDAIKNPARKKEFLALLTEARKKLEE